MKKLEMFPQTTRERIAREIASGLFHPEDDIGVQNFVEAAAAPNGWLNQYMLRKAIERRTETETQKAWMIAYMLDGIARFIIK